MSYKCSIISNDNSIDNSNIRQRKNEFKDTGNLKIIDYIKTKLDDLERDIEAKKQYCQTSANIFNLSV